MAPRLYVALTSKAGEDIFEPVFTLGPYCEDSNGEVVDHESQHDN